MAIVSVGYPTTVGATNVDWAQMQFGLGRRYWVYNESNVKVTPKTDGTRQVNISPGHFGGYGVKDYNDSVATVTLPSVTTGTRWFMIVARRNWNPGQAGTTFTYIDAGTSNATLPARNGDGATTGGGTGIDDQPLALVPLTAGDTVPGTPIDLRVVAAAESVPLLAKSELVLQYMAYTGAQVRIGNVTWTRVWNSGYAGVWERDPTIVRSGPGMGNALGVGGAAGWATVSRVESRGTATGPGLNDRKLLLQAVHSSSSTPISFSADQGNVEQGDTPILSVNSLDWQPPYDIPGVSFEYRSSSGATYGGTGRFTSNGNFVILAGAPGTSIGVRTDNTWSIRARINWTREA